MKRTNEPTMEDAHEAISNAVKEEERKLQIYPKKENYDEFLDELSKEGYCLCGPLDANEIRIKNSRNGYLAAIIIRQERIKSEGRDNKFEKILIEHTTPGISENKNNPLRVIGKLYNNKMLHTNHQKLKRKIKEMEKEILQNYNGHPDDIKHLIDEQAFLEIEKYYDNYRKEQKPQLNQIKKIYLQKIRKEEEKFVDSIKENIQSSSREKFMKISGILF